MRMFSFLVAASSLLCLIQMGFGLRILLFCPGFGKSHLVFNGRLAAALQTQGHNVTMLNQYYFNELLLDEKLSGGAEVINFRAEVDEEFTVGLNQMQNIVFTKTSPITNILLVTKLRSLIVANCEHLLLEIHKKSILADREFDIALSHPFDYCPFAASRMLGVYKYAWVTPGTYIVDNGANLLGIPRTLSYIPIAFTELPDRMDFFQRVKNLLMGSVVWLQYGFYPRDMLTMEEAIVRKLGSGFRIAETFANISYFLINGEGILNFPRPLPNGVLALGDLGASSSAERSQLEEPFLSIVDKGRKGFIVFSFGSIANTSKMPEEMRETYLNGFKDLSDYEILWKMDGTIRGLDTVPHVHLFSWLPQRDLLRHPNAKLFITHGGYNSLVEATDAGVPLLLIPLFADQQGNAARAQRHGIGLVLSDKLSITQDSFSTAMKTILGDSRFYANSKRLSLLMKDKITAPTLELHQRLLTLHKSERTPKLGLAQHLSSFQYFCLDMFLPLTLFGILFHKSIQ